MKKLLFFAIALFIIGTSSAQGGTTGPLTWNISNDTLYIGGSGVMPNYYLSLYDYAPWHDYMGSIYVIVIGEDVTGIGAYAFYYFHRLNCVISYASSLSCPKDPFSIDQKNVPLYIPCNTWQNYYGKFYELFDITEPNPDPIPDICMVSVNNNHNEIILEKYNYMLSYNIYREEYQEHNWVLIGTVDKGINKWVDINSNANMKSYRYLITSVSPECGEGIKWNYHKTTHLTINSGQNGSWNLIWTPYFGIQYNTYNIYRSNSINGEMELISTVPSNNHSYTDFNAPNGYVYYVIEIVIDKDCETGKAVSSIKSNLATNDPNVSIIDNAKIENIDVYPNPTSSILNVNINNNENVDYTLFNNLGQIIKQDIFNEYTTIDISSLPDGVYYMKILNEVKKIVKIK